MSKYLYIYIYISSVSVPPRQAQCLFTACSSQAELDHEFVVLVVHFIKLKDAHL